MIPGLRCETWGTRHPAVPPKMCRRRRQNTGILRCAQNDNQKVCGSLVDDVDEGEDGEGVEAGGDVVEHDAGAFGEALELADGWGLEDVEEAEEQEGDDGVCPVG